MAKSNTVETPQRYISTEISTKEEKYNRHQQVAASAIGKIEIELLMLIRWRYDFNAQWIYMRHCFFFTFIVNWRWLHPYKLANSLVQAGTKCIRLKSGSKTISKNRILYLGCTHTQTHTHSQNTLNFCRFELVSIKRSKERKRDVKNRQTLE